MAKVAQVVIDLTLKSDQFQKPLEQAGLNVAQFATGLAQLAGGVAILKSIGDEAWRLGSSFETSMAQVSTLIDMNINDFNKLKGSVKDTAAQYGYSAKDAADALYDMYSTGVDAADGIKLLELNMKAARGANAELGNVTDVVTSIMAAYGYTVDDVAMIQDKLIKTQDDGKVTIDEMAGSMGRILPVAKQMGVSFDDVLAGISSLTRLGMPAEVAITSLRQAIVQMGDNTSKSGKALGTMGTSFKQLMDEGKSLGDVIAILQQHAADTGQEFSDLFPEVNALAGASGIATNNFEIFNEALTNLNDSAGTTDEYMDNMRGTGEALAATIKSKLEASFIDLYDNIMVLLRPALQWLADNMDWLAPIFIGVSIAIGSLLIVLGLYNIAMAVAGMVTSAALAPFIAIAAALAAVGTAMVYLWNTNEEFRNKLMSAWEKLKAAADKIFGSIIAIFKKFGETAEDSNNIFMTMWDMWANAIGTIVLGIIQQITGVLEIIGGLVEFVTGVFTGDWEMAWDGVLSIFQGFVDLLEGTASQMFDPILSLFGTSVKEIKENVISFVGDTSNALITWATDTGQSIFDWSESTAGNIQTWAADTQDTIANWITTTVNDFDNWTGGALSGLDAWYKDSSGKISSWASKTLDSIIEWDRQTTEAFNTWVNESFSGLKTWFEDTLNGFGTWIIETETKLQEWWDNSLGGFFDWTNETGELLYQWFSGQDVDWDAWFNSTMEKINTWFTDTFSGFSTWVTDTGAKLTEWATGTIDTVNTWFATTLEGFNKWMTDTFNGIQTWGVDTLQSFTNWVNNTSTKVNEWKDKVIASIQLWAVQTKQAIGRWVEDTINSIVGWAVGIIDKVKETLNNIVNKFTVWKDESVAKFEGFKNSVLSIDWLGLGKRLIELIVNGISGLIGKIGETLRNAAQQGWDAITGFDWWSVGTNIVQGITGGIASIGSTIASSIGGFVGGAIDQAKGLLGIASPSKVFKRIFEYVGEGSVIGLENSMPKAISTLEKEIGKMTRVKIPDLAIPGLNMGQIVATGEAKFNEVANEKFGLGTANFYIDNKDPRAVAEQVSRILGREVRMA